MSQKDYSFNNANQQNIYNSEIISFNQAIDLIMQSVSGEKEDEMFDNEETDDDIADITEEYKNLVIVDEEELSQE